MSQANQNPESPSIEAQSVNAIDRDAASLIKLRALLVELEREQPAPTESDA